MKKVVAFLAFVSFMLMGQVVVNPPIPPVTSVQLDQIMGATRGAVAERGATGWTGIAPGTAGLPWVSNGAGADPSYQTVTGAGIAAATVANSNLANMAAGTFKCRVPGGSAGAPTDCNYPTVNAIDFGADPTGAADSTTAITNSLAALPVTGGIVIIPVGTYKVSTIPLGNGTSSTASTTYGQILRGQCAPTQPWFPGFPGNSGTTCAKLIASGAGDVIHVNGPLQSWGVQNLWIDCGGSGNIGLHITSAQFGDSSNLTFDNCIHSIYSDTVPIFGGLTNTDSYFNRYFGISITMPNVANAIGIFLSGQVTNTTSNTDYNTFEHVSVSMPNNNNVQVGIDLQSCDSNVFIDTKVFINNVNNVGVQFDYGGVNSGWPASNLFYSLDSSGPAGSAIQNSGTPGGAAAPNYIYGVVETNGFATPNLLNLAAYGSHAITLSPGSNITNTQLVAGNGHFTMAGASTPTLTGGCNGAGSSVSGNDLKGVVTGQTAAATTCTLTFARAYSTTPVCITQGNTTPLTGLNNNTASVITVSFNSTANFIWSYVCFGN